MITLVLPFFPPTTNHAFFVRHGRLHLSDRGRAFKENVVAYLTQHYMKELRFFKRNVPYFIYLRFFFEGGVENKGWNEFKRNGDRKSETRYKVFDATNRVKLTEDALKDAFGVDDSQFIAVLTQKMQGGPNTPEHFEVFVWDLEAERSPLDELTRL